MYICVSLPDSKINILRQIFTRHHQTSIFPFFLPKPSSAPSEPPSKDERQLTPIHLPWIRNIRALAYLGKKYYLFIKMSGKGTISQMSDNSGNVGFVLLWLSGRYAEVHIS
jgi:hypothetical protein